MCRPHRGGKNRSKKMKEVLPEKKKKGQITWRQNVFKTKDIWTQKPQRKKRQSPCVEATDTEERNEHDKL